MLLQARGELGGLGAAAAGAGAVVLMLPASERRRPGGAAVAGLLAPSGLTLLAIEELLERYRDRE